VYEHSIYDDLTVRDTKIYTVHSQQNIARSRRSGSTFKTCNKEHIRQSPPSQSEKCFCVTVFTL